ncbi:hypothetical protein CLOM_g23192 [Closterium sp. NIES-68]|nr:hypothetical protein CLOM_g23192 [Closterium sp. NIES-68]
MGPKKGKRGGGAGGGRGEAQGRGEGGAPSGAPPSSPAPSHAPAAGRGAAGPAGAGGRGGRGAPAGGRGAPVPAAAPGGPGAAAAGGGRGRGGRGRGGRGEQAPGAGGVGGITAGMAHMGVSAPPADFPALAPARAPAAIPAPAPAPVPIPAAAARAPAAAAPAPVAAAPPAAAAGVAVTMAGPAGVSSRALVAAARPGFGKAGRPVMLLANHFKIDFQDLVIYHYDVEFSPAVASKGVMRAVIRQLAITYQSQLATSGARGGPSVPVQPVFDGAKNLYTARALPFESQEFRVVLPDRDEGQGAGGGRGGASAGRGGGRGGRGGRGGGEGGGERRERAIKVTLKIAQQYHMASMDAFLKGRQADIPQVLLQALDVALRERLLATLSPVGRSLYSASLGSTALGGGVAGYRGFFQSVRFSQQGLALNVDMSATAFHQDMPLLDFAAEFLGGGGGGGGFAPNASLSDGERVKLRRALHGIKVAVTHRDTPRRYRVQGLTREPAHALSFTIEGQGETSLVAYFRSAYGYTVRHPNLPCVMAGGSGKSYLPMEVCRIVGGQRYGPKLSEDQVSNLLRFTCTRPDVRAGEIGKLVAGNDYPNDPYAREFGMRVHPEMTRLQGRMLDAPRLVYKDKKDVVPRFGAWNMMGGQRLIEGATITHWTILNFAHYLDAAGVQRFGTALAQRCAELGVNMNPRPVVPPLTGRVDAVEAVMRQLADASSRAVPAGQWLQLAVVILPGRGTFYNEIKLIAETQLNVVTQCCLVNHAQKCQSQYLANLVLKINVKLGGRNVLLQSESIGRLPMVAERPTVVFGADVTHPSPGDDSSPSIAAVVASRDWPCANRYGCLLRTQAHRQEIIEGLHEERRAADGSVVAGGWCASC